MSILTLAYPAQAAVSVAHALSGSVAVFLRTAVGVGVFGTLTAIAFVFKPLLVGIARATQGAIAPSVTAQQRYLSERMEGVALLNRLARSVDARQPSLAAEWRYLAARG